MDNNSEILLYQADNGSTKIDVQLQGKTVWLTQTLEYLNSELKSLASKQNNQYK
ncbi:MAG: hypothetical protein K9H64_02340 [Bacteroidales bacterium]|nr:hypothetical protein [Bacteroidales bacterium]MCF8454923.1 hypothetical protein [Bacteroidales bacterium]